jgi:integrase
MGAVTLIPVAETELSRLANLSAVSPEAALRRPLADLVAATLTAAGGSEHTRRAYQTAIGLFLSFLDRERGDMLPPNLATWRPFAQSQQEGRRTVWEFNGAAVVLRLIDASLLDSFRATRVACGDETETASLRVNAVRTFLRVALRDGVLTQEQALALGLKPYRARLKRDVQPVGRRLTAKEVCALRAAAPTDTAKGKRDLAMLDAMLFAGLRREEVAGLDLSDFRQDGGRWWIVLTGKGQKTRRVKVADPLYKSLSVWLEAVGLPLGQTTGPVFRSVNRGDAISARAINASVVGRLVAEYGAAASLAPLTGDNQLSAHDLRRTCARAAYDNGAPLLLVQAMLGHSDPSTTARYIGAYENDGETAVDFVRY